MDQAAKRPRIADAEHNRAAPQDEGSNNHANLFDDLTNHDRYRDPDANGARDEPETGADDAVDGNDNDNDNDNNNDDDDARNEARAAGALAAEARDLQARWRETITIWLCCAQLPATSYGACTAQERRLVDAALRLSDGWVRRHSPALARPENANALRGSLFAALGDVAYAASRLRTRAQQQVLDAITSPGAGAAAEEGGGRSNGHGDGGGSGSQDAPRGRPDEVALPEGDDALASSGRNAPTADPNNQAGREGAVPGSRRSLNDQPDTQNDGAE